MGVLRPFDRRNVQKLASDCVFCVLNTPFEIEHFGQVGQKNVKNRLFLKTLVSVCDDCGLFGHFGQVLCHAWAFLGIFGVFLHLRLSTAKTKKNARKMSFCAFFGQTKALLCRHVFVLKFSSGI